ncbi:DUF6195 family protein [Streptomyces monomycini]|uniref:DUF6195 family protein n=1 Tax=Streptomyces monomycini TaxID=371720 RepID=UPI0004A9FAED|nr:DUF6195 family protein [Streptomyces monomycini]
MTTTTDLTTVAELASRAFARYATESESRGDEMFEEHRAEFLGFARGEARMVLGEEAAALLDWQYTGSAYLPRGVNQATASLGEGRSEYLRYRITDGDESTFVLVQPCGTCGRDQVDEVRDLASLGALLDMAQALVKFAQGGGQ